MIVGSISQVIDRTVISKCYGMFLLCTYLRLTFLKVDIVVDLGVQLCAKNNVEVKTRVGRSSAIYCTMRLTMNIIQILI